MKEHLSTILKELESVLSGADTYSAEKLAEKINRVDRVFIAGNGRSGLAGKMFAMRLMHIGYKAYVVGETITPSISGDDLLIIISGSGKTQTLAHFAKKANEVNSEIALLTTNTDSPIASESDLVIEVPAVTKATAHERATIQPLGSQFDQSAHLLLDGIIVYLLEHLTKEDHEALQKKHTNLE
ncbi:6-phospho-3-hexuloisomerase [Piscibacillus halophilus]|uniref:6-phospho-3-hexuloisomerase n=1 Tax=Piscibacillus halophilus TaxID=571933 RepID=A0A1H9HNY7_9BACI|nr:6-phospho-3-hexuloisomerase [Piscibacillus halophilus]SEQ64059.1 6-phospho-3-hexuloisomerase [Piscibacillus halophilus]